jgi:hypothetical protein
MVLLAEDHMPSKRRSTTPPWRITIVINCKNTAGLIFLTYN